MMKRTILTTKEEVERAVKELKRKKCKDRTGWNNEIVLESGEDMIDGLHCMFNKMEVERVVPEEWKEMKIKGAKLYKPFRIAITGKEAGPELKEILKFMIVCLELRKK